MVQFFFGRRETSTKASRLSISIEEREAGEDARRRDDGEEGAVGVIGGVASPRSSSSRHEPGLHACANLGCQPASAEKAPLRWPSEPHEPDCRAPQPSRSKVPAFSASVSKMKWPP